MFLLPFFDLQNFILLVRTVPFLRKIIFISSYTEKNNYFLLYELIQDLPYILILTRFYIYKCRINNKGLNIAEWVKELKFFIHIEKKIAIKADRFPKFTKYWQKWLEIFENN